MKLNKFRIHFELEDKSNVRIMCGNKQIGSIFTPSGTMHNTPESIQICGFTEVFDFWGCGIYGDGSGNAKRDIQLRFDNNSQKDTIKNDLGQKICMRCFYPYNSCKCYDMMRQLKRMEKSIEKHHIRDLKRLCAEGLEK